MQKIKSFTFYGTAIAGLVWLVLSGGACSQNSSSASVKSPVAGSKPENSAATSTTNRQIEAAQKLIDKNPKMPNGYNSLAAAYIHSARETGDFSLNLKAETAVGRALEIEPENPTAQKLRTSLMLTFHRFAEALEAATSLQAKSPQDAFIYGVLTDANVELGNYKEAIDAAQKMVDLRPNMESYARVSHLRSLHGDSDGAIEAMRTAAKIADPMDKESQAWCLVHLGDEFFKIGNYAEAEKQYDTALNVFPDYHLALAGKGRARAAQNDFESAVKFLTESNNRVPNVEDIIYLGDVYSKIGKQDEATRQYELAQFIEQQSGNIDQRRLALLWADRDMKLDEALSVAAREHEAGKDIFTADIYAWCLYKKGQFPEAKRVISEAMRLKTKDARIFYHAGMIEKSLGNKKAAADYLRKALQMNPAFDILQAEKAKTALQKIN
ncbi:MAG TPA: tetratricopeptide repeat protein [Pyrinomonadaceae bacterium]|nr:tetratricopeptide repeat protein [Pyrinomonadaceae bacterium]